jgi:hypothetical protein
MVHFVTRLETSGEESKPVDDETKKRVELYTDWLQEWAKDLPGQITVAPNRTPYQWAIYRGDPPEKVGVLHPDRDFLVGPSTEDARQFLHQALKIKLMLIVP